MVQEASGAQSSINVERVPCLVAGRVPLSLAPALLLPNLFHRVLIACRGAARRLSWRWQARTHVHAGVIQQTPRGKKKDRTGGRGGPSLVSRRLSVELLTSWGGGRSST
jgi:hypothetical protein